jgi:predicted permease
MNVEAVTKEDQPAQLWYQDAEYLRTLPWVESAAVAGWALMSGSGWNQGVWVNGRSSEAFEEPWFLGVSPGWLETMRIPLLDGRDLRPDDEFPNAAVVNQTFAVHFFEGQSAVGKTFEIMVDNKDRRSFQIVGVAGDARYTDLRGPIQPTAYVPLRAAEGDRRAKTNWSTLVVRTKGPDPLKFAQAVRQEVPRGRAELRVANIRTQDELLRANTLRERLLAMLSLFFAIVALVLASVGLYGVLEYSVLERRRELGIRIALGARAADIVRQVTFEVFAMLAMGSLAGLGLGIASEHYIATLLFAVKATDPSMLALPWAMILAAATLASLPPVLRAVRLDPSVLLRAE